MLKLVWRTRALEDLDEVIGYIADRDADAAKRLLDAVEACAARLPVHPYLYRAGRVPGTREAIVHPNYLMIYRVATDRVEVVSFVHARRRYP